MNRTVIGCTNHIYQMTRLKVFIPRLCDKFMVLNWMLFVLSFTASPTTIANRSIRLKKTSIILDD